MNEFARPGTYTLVFRCPRAAVVRVGALGSVALRRGYLVYVGSAFGPGGIGGRLRHHLRPVVRPRWHVDYLRPAASLVGVFWAAGEREVEHRWAGMLERSPGFAVPIAGFGASDCECHAHLLATPRSPRSEEVGEQLAASCAPAELFYRGLQALRGALGV